MANIIIIKLNKQEPDKYKLPILNYRKLIKKNTIYKKWSIDNKFYKINQN